MKTRISLSILTIAGLFVLAGTYRGGLARGAASGPRPRVTAITQITHDGYRKTKLLADDSQLYVNEAPGLGVEVNEPLAKKFPLPENPGYWLPVRRQDGTAVRP